MRTSPVARVVLVLLAAVLASAALVGPAAAAPPAAPGNFTGYGFDTCVAPTQASMDAWNLSSPFSAIGIYVSGNSRYCGDAYQPNLSNAWVQQNADNGWRFLPIHVGYQSPCFRNNPDSRVQKLRMSTSLPIARSQARSDAAEAVAALRTYGFGAGSYIYLDLEWWARDRGACDNAVREFEDAFTETVHTAGFKVGLYSSGSAAIKLTDELMAAHTPGFTPPDQIWFAWTNQRADVDGGPYVGATRWVHHQRIHQYDNGVTLTYAGATLTIDKNWLDVGTGSVATKEPLPCGVRMTFANYPDLRLGANGPEVKALQCLLKQLGLKKTITGVFGTGTLYGVNTYRAQHGWARNGLVNANLWASLLAQGTHARVIKPGSVGTSVWNLQRALIAAKKSLKVTGVFDAPTTLAVRAYRTKNQLPAYATVEAGVWAKLESGHIG